MTSVGKEAFLADEDKQAAVLYYLHTLAESTIHLSEVLKNANTDVPWQKIRGFRNIVVHSYLTINIDRVWDTIQDQLPMLNTAIEAMLANLAPDDGGEDTSSETDANDS
ncbi:MAG: DUF86 domain-containing protein [Anaerolineae bacterium]|nr:DUF86 domain-containing protein [Anaerolineae bacterium]